MIWVMIIDKDPNATAQMNPQQITIGAGLYIVPTPIGNLRDMTLRGLDILGACDAVLCEDSRLSGKLLKAYGISKKKIVYNDHSKDDTRHYIIDLLLQGKILALVSDAGSPMISDPGYKLVRDCVDRGIYVTALPGANAVLPAIQLSGLPSDRFAFGGFLPAKDKALRDMLGRYASYSETLVFYESPARLQKTLAVIAAIYGTRRMAVIREISKLYEESIRGTAEEIATYCRDHIVKGEIAVVIEGASCDNADTIDPDALIRAALAGGQSVSGLSSEIAALTGQRKKDIYARALAIQNKS